MNLFQAICCAFSLVCLISIFTIKADQCLGSPGELIELNSSVLQTSGDIFSNISYQCVVNGELKTFYVTGGIEVSSVYRVEPGGNLTIIQENYAGENDFIREVAFFKCNNQCYVAAIGVDQYLNQPFLQIYQVNQSTGELELVLTEVFPSTQLRTVKGFVCNGICYIIMGGIPGDANLLFEFDGTSLVELQNYAQDTIYEIARVDTLSVFECEGIWWVVAGGRGFIGLGGTSSLYRLDPCASYLSETLVLEQSPFITDTINVDLHEATAYFWHCSWYVAVLAQDEDSGQIVLQNYKLDPMYATLSQVGANISVPGDDVVPLLNLTSYSCGCKCYVVIGGFAEDFGETVNSVYEVTETGAFSLVQSGYSDGNIRTIASYNGCGCFVATGGRTTSYTSSNEVFSAVNPRVRAQDDCYSVFENGPSIDIGSDNIADGIFVNDCGCFDPQTAIFYRDAQLTDYIGGPGYFGPVQIDNYNNDKGTLELDGNALIYTPPAKGPEDAENNPGIFHYTMSDCCHCQGCAQVTIFIKSQVVEVSEFNLEVEVPCDQGSGVIATATVTNPGNNTFTFEWFDAYNVPFGPADVGVTSSNSPVLLAEPNAYRVRVDADNIEDCGVSNTFTVASCNTCDLVFTITALPGLNVTLDENSATFCNNQPFCYELVVENQSGAPSGSITVTGLTSPLFTIEDVLDCSKETSQSYLGPVGNIWTNQLNPSITFDQSGTGTWSIPNGLNDGASLCLGLCVQAPVGNFILNVQATNAP